MRAFKTFFLVSLNIGIFCCGSICSDGHEPPDRCWGIVKYMNHTIFVSTPFPSNILNLPPNNVMLNKFFIGLIKLS
jgi:hypothetical protein